jgi:hypothetical protein
MGQSKIQRGESGDVGGWAGVSCGGWSVWCFGWRFCRLPDGDEVRIQSTMSAVHSFKCIRSAGIGKFLHLTGQCNCVDGSVLLALYFSRRLGSSPFACCVTSLASAVSKITDRVLCMLASDKVFHNSRRNDEYLFIRCVDLTNGNPKEKTSTNHVFRSEG